MNLQQEKQKQILDCRTMKVTDKDLYIEPKLKEKLDLMIKRMTGHGKRDNLLLIDGAEGDGKSNMASLCAYYVAYQTKRECTLASSMFFELDKLMDKAMHTKEGILIWDEGALGGLAMEWWRKNQQKFIKLLMVARKKRHFFIICIPKFYKLNEYLAVDRSIGLVHCYSKNETEMGRFVYFNNKKKEALWEIWRKSRKRNYKYYNFHGMFTITLPKVFNESGYEAMKDVAILSLDKDEKKSSEMGLKKNWTMEAMKKLKNKELNLKSKDLSDIFGYGIRNIQIISKEIDSMTNEKTQI